MALAIQAPDLESRLVELASRQGVTPEDYIRQLVETRHPPEQGVGMPAVAPLYKTAGVQEWLRAFDAWIDGHPQREPLPDDAFNRASFYEG